MTKEADLAPLSSLVRSASTPRTVSLEEPNDIMKHSQFQGAHDVHARSAFARSLLAAAVATSFIVGCATDDGASTLADETRSSHDPDGVVVLGEQSLNLVARVDLPHDGTVKFYEPSPGEIMTLESGRTSASRRHAPNEHLLDARAYYELLAGEPAPQALVDAVERAHQLAPRTHHVRAAEPAVAPRVEHGESAPAPGRTRDDAPPLALSNNLTRADFRANYCSFSGTDFTGNWLNGTGESTTGDRNDISIFRAAVYAHKGGLRFIVKRRPWYTWENRVDVIVPEGWWEKAEFRGNNARDMDGKASVINASSSTYDFCSQAS